MLIAELLQTAISGTPDAQTHNGAAAFSTTGDTHVDLFNLIGSSRGKDLSPLIRKAAIEDIDLTSRIVLFGRDVRGGAGEREPLAAFIRLVAPTFGNVLNTNMAPPRENGVTKTDGTTFRVALAAGFTFHTLATKIAEVGRYKDLLEFLDDDFLAHSCAIFLRKAIENPATGGLAAKWMPRKGPRANTLRRAWGMTPKEYRQFVVSHSNTIEQKLCARDFEGIELNHVPSLAMKRYQTALHRNLGTTFETWKANLATGKDGAKVNAGAVFPHQIINSLLNHDREVSTAQWAAQPDWFAETEGEFRPLCVVDTSGSMHDWNFYNDEPMAGLAKTMKERPIDVALGLALYSAERMPGPFKDTMVTFAQRPNWIHLDGGTIFEKANKAFRADCGGNTDLEATYKMLLAQAKAYKLEQNQMPTHLIILSDMEFDSCVNVNQTHLQNIKDEYVAAGYNAPTIVFWNLVGRIGNNQARANDKGVILVSGFSPAVLKSVFSMKEVTPREYMLECVMVDRYKVF